MAKIDVTGPAAISGSQNLSTVVGGSTTVTTSNNAFANVEVGAALTANLQTRYVTAKVSSTQVTVDTAVDWYNGGSGYSFTYKNPLMRLADEATNRILVRPNGTMNNSLDVTGDITAESWNINGMGGATPPWDMNSAAHQVYLNDSTARVGIGTNAPSEKLEINVTNELHAAVKICTDATTAPHCMTQLELSGLSNAPWATMQMTAPTGAGSEYLRFCFKNSSGTTLADILNISRLGNVGVGVTSPNYPLSVAGVIEAQGTGYSGDLIRLGNDAKLVDVDVENTVGLFGLTTPAVGSLKLGSGGGTISGYNGCIGVGTASPDSPLHVKSSSTVDIKAETTNAANDARVVFKNPDKQWFAGLRGDNNDSFIITEDNLYHRLAITAGGKIGVGTVSPGFDSDLEKVISIDGGDDDPGLEFKKNATDTSFLGVISFNHPSASPTRVARILARRDGNADAAGIGLWVRSTGGSLSEKMWLDSNGNMTVDGSISGGGQVFVDSNGYLKPKISAAANAPDESIYIDSTSRKLCFRDKDGDSHDLY